MDLGDIASSWSSRILKVENQCIVWDRRRDAANNNGDPSSSSKSWSSPPFSLNSSALSSSSTNSETCSLAPLKTWDEWFIVLSASKKVEFSHYEHFFGINHENVIMWIYHHSVLPSGDSKVTRHFRSSGVMSTEDTGPPLERLTFWK